jgi:hypothetical protein
LCQQQGTGAAVPFGERLADREQCPGRGRDVLWMGSPAAPRVNATHAKVMACSAAIRWAHNASTVSRRGMRGLRLVSKW